MKNRDIKDYNFNTRGFDFANLLDVEQSANRNGSVDTFYNINNGVYIDGIDNIPSDSIITYTCRNNDDLRFISFDLYGSTEYWWIIAKLNKMEDCLVTLKAGQKIKALKKYYMSIIYDRIKESI